MEADRNSLMSRLYTDIKIEHETEQEQVEFREKLKECYKQLGLSSRAEFVRFIVAIDAATGILEKLKESNNI